MALLITRSPVRTVSSPGDSSALQAVDTTIKTNDVLVDLSTDDILLNLSKDELLKDEELRRQVFNVNEKLEAAKRELDAAEEKYYEASQNWNAALEQPNLTDGQTNDLWDQCEDTRKLVQPLKFFFKKIQEQAEMAKVALRNFENHAIQAKMCEAQLAFSIHPAAANTGRPARPFCTCVNSIIDCGVCHSLGVTKRLPDHQKSTSSTKEQMGSADTHISSTEGKSSTAAEPEQPTYVARFRNKYGDIPNPRTQMKAGRRRRNQDLRKRDPEHYRQLMIEKKAMRDAKLRALRYQQRRPRW